MPGTQYHSWVETDLDTDAVVTATRAAPGSGALSHYITSISGSFSAAVSGATLELKQGATVLATWHVYNELALVLPSPIKLDPGTVANLVLAAGGSGVDGVADMTGYTL